MTTTTRTRTGTAALYCRLSKKQATEKVMTLAEQEKVLRADAARLGLDVIGDAYVDDGISAYKRTVRPRYADLLAAIGRREFSHVLVCALDRASRRVGDVAALLDTCETAGVTLVVDGKNFDPSDDALPLYLSAIVGENESREKSKRVKRAKVASLGRGLYAGGRRPFGFRKIAMANAGWYEQIPAEAKAIRDGFDLIMSGGALVDVARLWNKKGIVTSSKGNAWSYEKARRALTSPIVAGIRTSRGETVGPLLLPDGSPWPAILTGDEHAAIVAALAARYGDRPRWHSQAPSLLSGLIKCGACGSRMPIRRYRDGRAVASYACVGDGANRCGKVGITAPRIEADIEAAVLDLLANSKAVKKAMRAPKPLRAKGDDPARLQAKLDDLADMNARDEITTREWLRQRKIIEERLTAARVIDDTDDRARVLRGFDTDPVAAWNAADLERRRAVLSALIERIEVSPTTPGTRKVYDLGRVRIVWQA